MPWWQVSLRRSVVEGLFFWILNEFGFVFVAGIEGSGFLLYSDIRAGSLGVYEACGRGSDLGGEERGSQSSESVGDGDVGGASSTVGNCTRPHSLIKCCNCVILFSVSQ